MEDKKILQLLWERSETGLDALKTTFGKTLYRMALNILGSSRDAEEVVSDTYLALWDSIPPQCPQNLSAYTYRTGKHLALKKLRFISAQKRSSQYEVPLEELAGVLPGGSVEEAMDAKLLGKAINDFLTTLDQTNRRIFLRRYWFGDSVAELSKAEHLTANALSLRLLRLREALRTHLEKEDIHL